MSEDLLVDGYDYNPHTCMVEVPYNNYLDMNDKCKENKQLKSQLQQKENIIKETDKELERLQLSYQESWEDRVRLNNIINELEKYIKTNAPREIRGNITGDYEVYIDGQFLFNKLQELKGE